MGMAKLQNLSPKEDLNCAVLAINIAAKAFFVLYITYKTEHFSFKSGCVVRVAKHIKDD